MFSTNNLQSILRKGADGRILKTNNIGKKGFRPSLQNQASDDLTVNGSQSTLQNLAENLRYTSENLLPSELLGSNPSTSPPDLTVNGLQSIDPNPVSIPFVVGSNIYVYTDSDISPIWREEIVEVLEKDEKAVKAIVKIYF